MPVVIGAAEYPEDIIETLGKDHKVYTVNATEEAKKIGKFQSIQSDCAWSCSTAHGLYKRTMV